MMILSILEGDPHINFCSDISPLDKKYFSPKEAEAASRRCPVKTVFSFARSPHFGH